MTLYSTEAVWREVTFALLSASECLRVPPYQVTSLYPESSSDGLPHQP